MEIYTLTCSSCGTIVAANELEKRRVMTCPGLECEEILRFESLPDDQQEHVEEYRERYRME